jgi:hypothetical protein
MNAWDKHLTPSFRTIPRAHYYSQKKAIDLFISQHLLWLSKTSIGKPLQAKKIEQDLRCAYIYLKYPFVRWKHTPSVFKQSKRNLTFHLSLCHLFAFGETTWSHQRKGVQHMPAFWQPVGIRQSLEWVLMFGFFLFKRSLGPKGKQWKQSLYSVHP